MEVRKTLKTAETIVVAVGAITLSAAVWWPLGLVGAGYWYYKRRWKK